MYEKRTQCDDKRNYLWSSETLTFRSDQTSIDKDRKIVEVMTSTVQPITAWFCIFLVGTPSFIMEIVIGSTR